MDNDFLVEEKKSSRGMNRGLRAFFAMLMVGSVLAIVSEGTDVIVAPDAEHMALAQSGGGSASGTGTGAGSTGSCTTVVAFANAYGNGGDRIEIKRGLNHAYWKTNILGEGTKANPVGNPRVGDSCTRANPWVSCTIHQGVADPLQQNCTNRNDHEIIDIGANGCIANKNNLIAIWYLKGTQGAAGNTTSFNNGRLQTRMSKSAWDFHVAIRSLKTSDLRAPYNTNYYRDLVMNLALAEANSSKTIVCVWPYMNDSWVPEPETCLDYRNNSYYHLRMDMHSKNLNGQPTTIPSNLTTVNQKRRRCFVHCPTRTSSGVNTQNYTRSGRANKPIPKSQTRTRENWGAYCFNRPNQTQTRTDTRVVDSGSPQTYTAVSNMVTEVGFDDRAGGYRTHASQPSNPTVQTKTESTAWATLMASVRNGATPTQAQINAAIAASANPPRPKVTLNANNKRAFAEGGIIEVTEREVPESLNVVRAQNQERTCTRSRGWNFTQASSYGTAWNGNPAIDSSMTSTGWSGWSCGSWRNVGGTTPLRVVSSTTNTPNVTGYWQAFANHCNPDAVQRSLGEHPGNTVLFNDGKWSGSIITPNLGLPQNKVLGYSEGTRVNAFDKECAWNGVRVTDGQDVVHPDGRIDTGDGGGADGDGVGDSYTLFRDNEWRTITFDRFVPRSEGVVNYSNQEADTTTVIRWKDGTPQVAGLQNEGSFRMQTLDGQPVFSASNAAPKNQRNWSNDLYNTRNAAQVEGEHEKFQVAANWASENGEPQVLMVKWEYSPMVANTLPTTNLGFNNDGTPAYTTTVESVPIQGKVYSDADSNTVAAEHDVQINNTGTGTTNTVDASLFHGTSLDSDGKWTEAPNSFHTWYYVLEFVRATSE